MAKSATARKARTTAAPADETKSQKFSRLASQRVSKAVKAIKQIGNLSGAGYERTDEQVDAIGRHLMAAITATKEKFSKAPGKTAEPEIKI